MKTIFTNIILFLLVQNSFPQNINIDKIDILLKEFVEERFFSGVVLIGTSNEILYTKTIGFADWEKQIPNEVSTNFNIASIGKVFTATLIMQLVENNVLSLDDAISKWLPEYNLPDSLTIFDVITHSAGTGNYMMHKHYDERIVTMHSLDSVMNLVSEQIRNNPIHNGRFEYSNSGYIILGRIIEKATGHNYQETLQKFIFAKTNIKKSYIHHPATFIAPGEAIPYIPITKDCFLNDIDSETPGFSDGGMQSNVLDMYSFLSALLKNTMLTSETLGGMWEARREVNNNSQMALGWFIYNSQGKELIGHNGGGRGFSSSIRISKEDDLILIAVANTKTSTVDLLNGLFDLYKTGVCEIPEMYPQYKLMEIVNERGINHISRNFSQVMLEINTPHSLKERDFVEWLYLLGRMKMEDELLVVFDLARKEFPENPSIWFSAIESLMNTDIRKAQELFDVAVNRWENNPYANYLQVKLNRNFKN
ncbi:serine hydrolase [Maribellus comscasis]|uniref:Serine hydrolase n=1 Tax=Maribellus comscasis TaxID=2681766 RepID=A0A6I6JU16_9BACT|nr:serine hydrolase domain-containing protein [Maribellus comscasis]QGY46516.1 serine hydrolase [Maribellus comscasis]